VKHATSYLYFICFIYYYFFNTISILIPYLNLGCKIGVSQQEVESDVLLRQVLALMMVVAYFTWAAAR
jgi:hypothetical protein